MVSIRTRPQRLASETTYIETGHGPLYVTVSFDSDGAPFEVFAQMKHPNPHDQPHLEALNRMVSLCLRGGIRAPEIIEMLRRATCCPVYDPAVKGLVRSMPDAIAIVLEGVQEDVPVPEVQDEDSDVRVRVVSTLPAFRDNPDEPVRDLDEKGE